MLIKNATIWPDQVKGDIRFGESGIEAISQLLAQKEGEAVLDAQGALVLPGLHDHHIHLNSYAASLNSLSCESLADASAFEDLLRSHEDSETAPELRIIHYHNEIAGDIDRLYLDCLLRKRPARVQHKTGRLWVFNSAGLRVLGLEPDLSITQQQITAPTGLEHIDGVLTGRLYDEDNWLQQQRRTSPPDLTEASLRLASYGVTGVTDTTPSNGRTEWDIFRRAQYQGVLQQRVRVMGRLELAQLESSDHITLGEHKIHLLESQLPLLETVAEQIRCAHKSGRSVAVHCATRVELIFTLGAFEIAGVRVGDRIEHNSVCGDHELSIIRDLGLRVVTQPHFIDQRGDHYLAEVERHDQPDLYRLASLKQAGIPLAFGSDAPFGDANPWRAIWSATKRTSQTGQAIGKHEALSAEEALGGFLYDPDQPGVTLRTLTVGAPADLVLLNAPWKTIKANEDINPVARTWIGGREAYRAN